MIEDTVFDVLIDLDSPVVPIRSLKPSQNHAG